MLEDTIEHLEWLLNDLYPSSEEFYTCRDFIEYLKYTSTANIVCSGVDDSGKIVSQSFGYPHRYTENYIKGRYAKLYLLDDWYQKNRPAVTFLTITLRHDTSASVANLCSGFERLQESKRFVFRELRRILDKRDEKLNYVGVVEPHENGFPHLHLLVFHSFSDDERIDLMRRYESWGFGSFEHGLDFDERPDTDIENMRNYLMKYMAKSFPDYRSKFSDDGCEWSVEYLLFNAVAWKYHFRTWCASNDLSEVMSYKKPVVADDLPVDWYKTELSSSDSTIVLWRCSDMIPAMIEEGKRFLVSRGYVPIICLNNSGLFLCRDISGRLIEVYCYD